MSDTDSDGTTFKTRTLHLPLPKDGDLYLPTESEEDELRYVVLLSERELLSDSDHSIAAESALDGLYMKPILDMKTAPLKSLLGECSALNSPTNVLVDDEDRNRLSDVAGDNESYEVLKCGTQTETTRD